MYIILEQFPFQFSSVAQSYPTLCDPMNCSTPGLPVHHQLLESTQTHLHWVDDAIQTSYPLSSSFPVVPFSCLQSFPTSGSFQVSQLFTSSGQSIGVLASTSVLTMNTQHWSHLGWTDWISLQAKELSRVFSNTTVQKHQFKKKKRKNKSISSSALSFLYSPTLTSLHDYWKNHSFDEMDLCWQSNGSAFF